MKSKLVLIAVVCLVATAVAQVPWGGESEERPRAEVYLLEGLGALGGCAGCGLAGGGVAILVAAALAESEPAGLGGEPNWAAAGAMLAVGVVGCGIVAPVGAAYATSMVGNKLEEGGSVASAMLGAYAGAVVGAGSGILAYHVGSWTVAVVGALAIPAGAVVGYNLGINRAAAPGGFGGRLQPLGVALTSMELPDHSVYYGVKVQLAGLRF